MTKPKIFSLVFSVGCASDTLGPANNEYIQANHPRSKDEKAVF
jgi:hypothetical protein